MLQNTVYDVRKLIEVSNNENQETIEYLHKEIEKMSIKKSQYKAVLTLVQGNNNHLQKCMLFWNSFPWYLYSRLIHLIHYFPRPALYV